MAKPSYSVDTDNETITFDCVVNSAYRMSKEGKDGKSEPRNTLNVSPTDKGVFDVISAYEHSGDKYTPDWFKGKEHIMLRSVYDIPVKLDGKKSTFADFLEKGLIKNAKGVCRIKQKDGAIYPVALVINEDGEEYDAFEGM